MIRTVAVLLWWGVWTLIHGIWAIPWMLITRNANPVFRTGAWVGRSGVWLAGIRLDIRGRENLVPGRTYIFMSNHVSNLDPPIVIPALGARTSVLVKKELFRIPILGTAMRMASLVAVDRTNREAAISSMSRAADALRSGLHMTIFPEGTRSADGRLQQFKKGPFYLAEQSGVPVVPVSIAGTNYAWPKHRFAMKPGVVTLTFHKPVSLQDAGDRLSLMSAVRDAINDGLPPDQKGTGSTNSNGDE